MSEASKPQRLRQLRVVHGPGQRRLLVVLRDAAVPIGRKGHVDGGLALEDSEVSRQHALLEPDPATGGWVIADRGSRNGVYVQGALVDGRCPLADGVVIRLGSTLLLYEDLELRRGELLVGESRRVPGQSLAIQRVRGEVARAARGDAPVLIVGETGIGMELVAEDLHEQSGRAGRFVAIDCAALPASLAESELLGSLAARSEGLIAAAAGGTVFLDEIGALPLELQPKLARVLATREVRAIGSAAATRVDARFVASTHVDLERAVRLGTFRADLLAALAAVTIEVPPLRARRDDILPLAEGFVRAPFSADAAEALLIHDWPGNVLELEQALAAVAEHTQDAGVILLEHLPPGLGGAIATRAPGEAAEAP